MTATGSSAWVTGGCIAELAGGVGAPAIGLVAQSFGAGGLTAGRQRPMLSPPATFRGQKLR